MGQLDGYYYAIDTDTWRENLTWYGYNTFRYASGCAAANDYIYSFGGFVGIGSVTYGIKCKQFPTGSSIANDDCEYVAEPMTHPRADFNPSGTSNCSLIEFFI